MIAPICLFLPMSERAEEIGATLLLDTAPGEGTKVSITWEDPAGEEIDDE